MRRADIAEVIFVVVVVSLVLAFCAAVITGNVGWLM